MSTKELLEIVKSRGLRIVLRDGRPVLEGASGNPAVTDKLLSALRFHRERIIEILKPNKGG
jgi:hypothetical protein